jgi:hypothetical protein
MPDTSSPPQAMLVSSTELLLARIDERTTFLARDMSDLKSSSQLREAERTVKEMEGQKKVDNALDGIHRKIEDLAKTIADTYVTKEEIKPYTRGIQWLIGLVISAIVLGGLAFLIRQP